MIPASKQLMLGAARPFILAAVTLFASVFGGGAHDAYGQRTAGVTARLTIPAVARVDTIDSPIRMSRSAKYVHFTTTVRVSANTDYTLVAAAEPRLDAAGNAEAIFIRDFRGDYVRIRSGRSIRISTGAGPCEDRVVRVAYRIPKNAVAANAGRFIPFRLHLRAHGSPTVLTEE